jgi:hypothetical protein
MKLYVVSSAGDDQGRIPIVRVRLKHVWVGTTTQQFLCTIDPVRLIAFTLGAQFTGWLSV